MGSWRGDAFAETDEDPFADPDEIEPKNDKGPWFTAGFDSDDDSCCGEGIYEGDVIRADGEGGWEHQDCVEDDR
jgi:hypothetical protein